MRAKMLALTRYGSLGSSSRLRMLQYFPTLASAGFDVQVQPLFDDEKLAARYRKGDYGLATLIGCYSQRILSLLNSRKFHLIWIEKEALPWCPLWLEQLLVSGKPYVLDFDDAVFHHYDRHRFSIVRHLYGKRIDRLMAKASLVVCGNEYLAQRAKHAGAPWVEVLPTVIDLERYPINEQKNSSTPRIVWIGSPSTVKYLNVLREPLQALAKKIPFQLRVIGGELTLEGVQTECLRWTEASEVRDIMECDVGVMPLENTPWELGKCGYKLIQYMACGLPVVASPVGVNATIVEQGVNGFLATSPNQWLESFERLLSDEQIREILGTAGRDKVKKQYCLQVTGPKLVRWLSDTAERASSGNNS